MDIKAVNGKMGVHDYYVAVLPVKDYVAAVTLHDYTDEPAHARLQRELDTRRVANSIVPYLRNNEDRFFSAIVCEFDGGYSYRGGTLHLNENTKLSPLDGQHRTAALISALEDTPALADDTVTLILLPHRSTAVSQQLFTDLNRNAKPTQRALNVTFDHRDPNATHAKTIAESEWLAGRVNYMSGGLAASAGHITSISTLYTVVSTLVESVVDAPTLTEADLPRVWGTVMSVLPGMAELRAGTMTSGELRQRYLWPTGLMFECLASVTGRIIKQHPDDWQTFISVGIPAVDWSWQAAYWSGVATSNNRLIAGRGPRNNIKALLTYMLALEQPAGELQGLRDLYASLGHKMPKPVVVPEVAQRSRRNKRGAEVEVAA